MANSLTAAVQRMEVALPGAGSHVKTKREDWQEEAWRMYDEVGELSSVCQWMGNSASRVNLFAAVVDAETGRAETPSDDPLARAIVDQMGGGVKGQSDILRQAATLLTVVGEFYVAIVVSDDTGEEEWHLVPPHRVTRTVTGGVQVNVDGKDREIDEQAESIFRVWNRHPKNSDEAHSSVRAALPSLREIRAMDRVIQAAARSRVSGAGLLLVPAETNLPRRRPPRGGDAPGLPPSAAPGVPEDDTTSFARSLYETMTRANEDQDSPAAIAPIVLKVPGDQIERFKHLTFDSEIEAQALETRERAIKRLAQSLDVPPEVLTGLGDSTHWNAELVDEASLRQHIAPLIGTICEALTEAVLLPLLEGAETGGENVVVGFDLSSLSQKQDKTDAALAAYDKGVISAAALRRELGFSDEDAPDTSDPDYLRSLAEKMVSQAPSLFPYLAEVLGFPTPSKAAIEAAEAATPAAQQFPRAVEAGGESA